MRAKYCAGQARLILLLALVLNGCQPPQKQLPPVPPSSAQTRPVLAPGETRSKGVRDQPFRNPSH